MQEAPKPLVHEQTRKWMITVVTRSIETSTCSSFVSVVHEKLWIVHHEKLQIKSSSTSKRFHDSSRRHNLMKLMWIMSKTLRQSNVVSDPWSKQCKLRNKASVTHIKDDWGESKPKETMVHLRCESVKLSQLTSKTIEARQDEVNQKKARKVGMKPKHVYKISVIYSSTFPSLSSFSSSSTIPNTRRQAPNMLGTAHSSISFYDIFKLA